MPVGMLGGRRLAAMSRSSSVAEGPNFSKRRLASWSPRRYFLANSAMLYGRPRMIFRAGPRVEISVIFILLLLIRKLGRIEHMGRVPVRARQSAGAKKITIRHGN